MKSKPFLWQLILANLLITIGALLVVTWYMSAVVRDVFFDQMRQGLESRAHLIESRVAGLALTSRQALQDYCRQSGRQAATRITVIAADGSVLADSTQDPANMENHSGRPEIEAALGGRTGTAARFSHTLGKDMLYVAIPLAGPRDHFKGALRMSLPVSSINDLLHELYLKVFAGCILVALLAAAATFLVSRRIIHPLDEMKKGVELLAGGKTDTILTLDTSHMSAEVFSLARSLKRMAWQIKERINTITLQHNELETVFSSMAEMVLAIDKDKRIIRLNRSAAALFYLSPEDVQGKMFHGVIRNTDLNKMIDDVLASGTRTEKDITLFVGPDRIYLHTRTVPLKDEWERPIGVLMVLTDMTRLHRLENMRRDFVANVSHELKTPVTSIRGYVETLLDGALEDPDDARRFLEIVAKQTSRLDAIIDDLLTLSRIELKKDNNDISFARVRLTEILEAAVQTCQVRAEEKNIAIAIECDEHLQAVVNPNLMEQAVINLLTNSVTYSADRSTVAVRAHTEQQAGRKKRLVISVEDHGIGIAREHLERLFERFYRCDKARRSAQGGTGLGLSIVKHIAMVHGGFINVQSEPGRGSTFSLTIPQ